MVLDLLPLLFIGFPHRCDSKANLITQVGSVATESESQIDKQREGDEENDKLFCTPEMQISTVICSWKKYQ